MINEIWLPIDGYLNYEVSDRGRVRNINGNVLITSLRKNNYLDIKLRSRQLQKNFLAHRLVALAFIPNPDGKPEVNHIDGVKTNNHVSNLEWVTSRENKLHARAIGLPSNQGSKCPSAKLTESDILTIRSLLDSGEMGVSIARRFGVSKSVISSIKSRRNWAHVA